MDDNSGFDTFFNLNKFLLKEKIPHERIELIIDAFRTHEVNTPSAIRLLNDNDFNTMKIVILGDRKKILAFSSDGLILI
jgi:hypothetical protein